MKPLMYGLLIASAALIGCQKESTPGGPGAATNGAANAKETFTLKVPAGNVNIQQGHEQEVTVTIDRGSDFKQKVDLSFAPPSGIKVDPKTVEIPADQSSAKIKIGADEKATTGAADVNVEAKPQAGKPVSQRIAVMVEAKRS